MTRSYGRFGSFTPAEIQEVIRQGRNIARRELNASAAPAT